MGTVLLGGGCYGGVPDGGASGGGGTEGAGSDGDVGSDGSDGAGDDAGEGGSPEASCADGLDFSPTPMARLTRDEYTRAVVDLFGVTPDTGTFVGDERLGPFAANVATAASKTAVLAYRDAAESVAAEVSENYGALLSCDAGASSAACAEQFVTEYGRRAFRRPLASEEHARLMAVFNHGASESEAYGYQLVVEAMLQDPNMLYRVELGTPDPDDPERLRLTDYEVATRMALLLWGTIPDDALLDEAEAGTLLDTQARQDYARQMLADPRARQGVARLYTQWFGAAGVTQATKDPNVFPEFTPQLAAAMQTEVAEVAAAVVLNGDGDLTDLLTTRDSKVTADLADYYGVQVAGSPDANGLYDVALPAGERAGLLTRAGVMAHFGHADQTAPVLRGLFVWESILCEQMPPPPPTVDDTVPPAEPATTARERFEQHRTDPTCAACHDIIDPLGFGFEHYDGAGRYRTMDGSSPVDASGELSGVAEGATFNGAIELSQLLADSEELAACAIRQHAALTFGRTPDLTGADACWIDQLGTAFAESDGSLSELLIAVVGRENFAMRKVADAPEEN